jgi:hypothetical protein
MKNKHKIKKQSGAILLLSTLFLSTIASIFLINMDDTNIHNNRIYTNNEVLQQGKQALLDYAAVYYELEDNKSGKMGFLPCPDYRAGVHPAAGYSDGNCEGRDVNVIGRFPWKSMKTIPFKDDSGSCLWYALSGSFKNSSKNVTTGMLNEDSKGNFTVFNSKQQKIYGNNPQDRVVAILFAPSHPYNFQNRKARDNKPCREDYDPASYLEKIASIKNYDYNSNPHSIDNFAKTDLMEDKNINDNIITITADEIFANLISHPATQQRFTTLSLHLAKCIAEYGKITPKKKLPYPVFADNLVDYRMNKYYTDKNNDGSKLFGRYPIFVPATENIYNKGYFDIIENCSSLASNPQYKQMFANYKDHFFYAVSYDHSPAGSVISPCSSCLKVNNSGSFAAVVLFANIKLDKQTRTEPPVDVDEKYKLENYLEGGNRIKNNTNFQSQTINKTFNDILYCIKTNMEVIKC